MIKWLAILFIVFNVTVFFLRSEAPEKTAPIATPMAKNMAQMVLNNEMLSPVDPAANLPVNEVVEESIAVAGEAVSDGVNSVVPVVLDQAKKAKAAIPALGEPEAGEKLKTVESQKPSKAVSAVDPTPQKQPKQAQCYRVVGLSEAASTRLRGVLNARRVLFVESRTGGADKAGLEAVRVYMGPYAVQAALDQQLAGLKARGIDAYAMTRPMGRIIQMGYFSKAGEAEANAKAQQEMLRAKGLPSLLERVSSGATQAYNVAYKADDGMQQQVSVAAKLSASQVKTEKCR